MKLLELKCTLFSLSQHVTCLRSIWVWRQLMCQHLVMLIAPPSGYRTSPLSNKHHPTHMKFSLWVPHMIHHAPWHIISGSSPTCSLINGSFLDKNYSLKAVRVHWRHCRLLTWGRRSSSNFLNGKSKLWGCSRFKCQPRTPKIWLLTLEYSISGDL